VIFVDQSAESVAPLDLRAAWLRVGACRVGREQRESAVWALAVVVRGVGARHLLEVAAADDQESVETFGADGADEALGVGIRLRGEDRRVDHLDPLAAECPGRRRAELSPSRRRCLRLVFPSLSVSLCSSQSFGRSIRDSADTPVAEASLVASPVAPRAMGAGQPAASHRHRHAENVNPMDWKRHHCCEAGYPPTRPAAPVGWWQVVGPLASSARDASGVARRSSPPSGCPHSC
jgi:hypothetical protein